MDGIIAKRTLKRSYYDNNIGINSMVTGDTKEKTKAKYSYKEKIIFKLLIQTVTVLAILTFAFAVKFLNIGIVKESDIVNKLKVEWNKNYTYVDIKNGIKTVAKDFYIFVKPIIPNEVEDAAKSAIKKAREFLTKNVSNSEVKVYEETNNTESKDTEQKQEIIEEKDETKEEEKNDNLGASTEDEEKVVSVMSSLSYEDVIVEEIEKLDIEFVKPVVGKITSEFGAREVIFEGVDSYHTGIDIGASSGTKVVSSTSGKVTVATYNKYNGNYVEITNGDVVTKYCHLSKISVKKGATVKAGTKIGEVGSTGLSTGPHLHFEVVYDGTKINPTLLVEI